VRTLSHINPEVILAAGTFVSVLTAVAIATLVAGLTHEWLHRHDGPDPLILPNPPSTPRSKDHRKAA
jgi:hypothetical protein